jgi:hypothetical protein
MVNRNNFGKKFHIPSAWIFIVDFNRVLLGSLILTGKILNRGARAHP